MWFLCSASSLCACMAPRKKSCQAVYDYSSWLVSLGCWAKSNPLAFLIRSQGSFWYLCSVQCNKQTISETAQVPRTSALKFSWTGSFRRNTHYWEIKGRFALINASISNSAGNKENYFLRESLNMALNNGQLFWQGAWREHAPGWEDERAGGHTLSGYTVGWGRGGKVPRRKIKGKRLETHTMVT